MKALLGIIMLIVVTTGMALIGIGFSTILQYPPDAVAPADFFGAGLSLFVTGAMLHGLFIK